ncbi:hypothetical protein SLNWT_4458 [Streptomyces albus]|uniref:Uncharacterized protein n=1 Tax=Streptomyces albus (strain ATCC 21838 / DSM 41398 / FERM P-419 / JCM 4703 / NBRC 107858) TaxID=1081613 RepID=A0A0B5ET44_STRA4|nr:hypothetical protein SLNWT_4458 [Streptomyces albus]AOU79140.1 hypothetical protein SLNHY_4449 [Streptomyces albus]
MYPSWGGTGQRLPMSVSGCADGLAEGSAVMIPPMDGILVPLWPR